MNILIINHYAGAPHLGREVRPYFLAKNWQAAGHHVTIAAADHTHLRHTAAVDGKGPELRRIGDVCYLFFPSPQYNDSITGRGRNIAAFVKGLWSNAESLAQEICPDVVIAQSGYPYDFFPAQRIASMAGAKTVLEVRDLWPLYLQQHYRYSPNHMAVRFAEYMLGRAIASADHVVRVLPESLRYLSRFGLKEEKSTLILSGLAAHNRRESALPSMSEKIKSFKADDFLMMYCGNIGVNHDLQTFVESGSLIEKGIKLVLVGNGGNKIMLKRFARQQELNNIMFVDGVLPSQIPSVLKTADALYFPLRETEQNQYGIASAKLLGYMLSGRPVICEGECPQNPVGLSNCGLVVERGNVQQLAGAIRLLSELSLEERQIMGKRGREYVLKERDYTLLSQQYLVLLEKLQRSKAKKT